MASTIANPRDRSLPETVQVPQAKAQRDPKVAEVPAELTVDTSMLSLIERARRRADLKLDHLARLSKISISTLSGALNGHGSFNVCWLSPWPAEFWNEYLVLLRAEKEHGPEAIRAQRKATLIRAIELLLEVAS